MNNFPPASPPLTIDEYYDADKVSLLISLGFKQSCHGSIFFSKTKKAYPYGIEIIEGRMNETNISWMIRWYPLDSTHPPYDHKASFQEIFDTLTPEQQEIAIWHLDILR